MYSPDRTSIMLYRDDSNSNGYPVDSEYVDRFWTPILGPSSVTLLRICSRYLIDTPSIPIEVEMLAVSLGMRRTLLDRTFGRLERFGIVKIDEPDVAMPVRLLQAPRHQLDKRGGWLVVAHDEYIERRRSVTLSR